MYIHTYIHTSLHTLKRPKGLTGHLCLLAPICVVLVCLSAAAVRQPHRRSKGLGRSVVHACARRASRGSGARVPGARVKTPHNLYTLFAAH